MRALILLILIPVYVSIAWLVYVGAKWAASFLFGSELDQVAAAALAAAVVIGAIVTVLFDMERNP